MRQLARSRPRHRARTRWLAPLAMLCVVATVCVSFGAGFAQTIVPGFLKHGGDSLGSRILPDGSRVIIYTGHAWLLSEDLRLNGDIGRIYTPSDEIDVVGNVFLQTDSLSLWCDSLHVWQKSNEGRAFGEVRIETEDGRRGFGQRAYYLRDRNWLALVGNARVLDETQMVAGDSISIDRTTGVLESFGRVVVVDRENEATVTGRHARFERATGLAIVDSLPVLTMREEGGAPMSVDGDRMVFDREQQISTAIGNVNFRQGLTRAHADTGRIRDKNLLVLIGSPSLEQEGRVMSGREIRIWSKEGKVEHIEVYDGAQLTDSTPDTLSADFSNIPLANTLSGDTLRIDFDEGKIVRTFVRGHAHSVYLPEDQEAAVSVNDVRGKAIDIRFREGLVDLVDITGGVEGIYRFFERPGPTAVEDSVLVEPDSLATDPADSLGGRIDFQTSAQTVKYTGETTRFDVPGSRIDISGTSEVQNGTLRLLAEDIHFDTEARELLAEDKDFVRLIDTDTELIGSKMGYLFEPQTGAVNSGATRFNDGFYEGKNIRRIDKSTLLIRSGRFTSCDLAEPHYHFQARKMKLKVGESVVARQVTMHVSNIPVMVLPFFYKDLKKGRRSGILFPNVNVGVSSREGRYVRDLGYYWATNDYTDFRFEMDYNERREATFTLENNYAKRYSFDGRVRFDYLRKFSDSTIGDEWKFTGSHNQPDLWEFWRLSTKFDISSSKITRTNLAVNHNRDLIDSRLYSTASLSRSFDNGMALNISGSRTQYPNAEDGDPIDNARISDVAIPVSLSFKSRPIVGGLKRPGANPVANFLRDFTFSQRYSGNYSQARSEAAESDKVNGSVNAGLTWAPDKVGPIRISSGVSFNDRWEYVNSSSYGYRTETVLVDSVEVDQTVADPMQDVFVDDTENTIGLNITNSASTDLYGIFYPRLGSLRGIKHKLTGSASWNLTPGIAGQQDRRQSIGLSLNNEFSLKWLDRREQPSEPDHPGEGEERPGEAKEGEKEPEEAVRKLDQFIRWSLRTSVNPDAEPGEQWANITSDIYLRPGLTNAVNFSVAQVIDPNTFEVTSTRFSSDLRLRGGLDLGGVLRTHEEPKNRLLEQLDPVEPDSTETGALDPDDPRYEEREKQRELDQWLEGGDRNTIPWEVYLRGSLNRDRDFSGNVTSRANLSTRASLSLPGEWKFSYSANFDVETGEFTNQFWRLSRPLHGWRLEFNRGLADGEDFGVSLYLVEIPDLRIDRGDRARQTGLGGGVTGF